MPLTKSLLSRVSLLLLFLASSAVPVWAADAKEAFAAKTYKNAGGKSLLYRQLSPPKLEAGQKYPLVIFLHGAGERGDDNTIQLVHGMNDFCSDANREKYPAYVIAPQCPTEKRWVEVDWSSDKHEQPEQPSESLGLTFELLQGMLKDKALQVDPERVYVTGLSMGGYGAWDCIQRHPDWFAAAIPICGGGDEKQAAKIKDVPVWAFHGDKDTAVKPERSRNMIAAIKKAGGEPKYTEYPGVGHNSWTQTYADAKVFEWLFAQRLKKAKAE